MEETSDHEKGRVVFDSFYLRDGPHSRLKIFLLLVFHFFRNQLGREADEG